MSRLDGCGTFVVLGATGAIGSALTRRLHADGARLLLVGRDEQKLRSLAAETDAHHAVLRRASAGTVANTLREACPEGGVAGIAHCIGSLHLKPAHRSTEAEWLDVLEVNLSSAFGVAMAAPDLVTNGGAVVFVSSVAATLGLANHEAIAAAKAGLVGLARSAAATNVRRGIRFHCVAPALVASHMTSALLARAGVAEAAARQNPSGRIGTPEDVARAIAFLLDPTNTWLDGQVLGVDGGFGTLRPLA